MDTKRLDRPEDRPAQPNSLRRHNLERRGMRKKFVVRNEALQKKKYAYQPRLSVRK
jgi:hypothetical protein